MSSRISTQVISPPAGGLNIIAPPNVIPDGQAQDLLNMLPRPGHVRNRGGIARFSTAIAGGNGLRGFLSTGYLEFGVAADVSGTATLRYYQITGAPPYTVSVTNVTASDPPDGFATYLGQDSYVMTASGKIRKHTGSNITTGTDFGGAVLVNTPDSLYTCIAEHQSHLFAAGYTGTGGSNLRWTDAGGVVFDSANEWKDDATGITNLIPTTESIVAMISAGGRLLLWSRRAMYQLTGSGPSTWSFSHVADVGCVSRDSLCKINETVAFFSDDGLYLFDGVASPRRVSDAIGPEIRPTLGKYISLNGNFATVTPLDADTLAISVGTGASTGAETTGYCGLYSLSQGGWARLTSVASRFAGNALGWMLTPPVARGINTTYQDLLDVRLAWDGASLLYIADVVRPELVAASPARFWRNGPLDYLSGTKYIPNQVVRSRRLRLGSPLQNSQLHRVAVDYVADTNAAWSLDVRKQPADTSLFTTSALTRVSGALDAANKGPVLDRSISDVFSEAADIDVVLSIAGGSTAASTFQTAIGDVTIEYQQTRDQPG